MAQESFATRLYRGQVSYDFIGRRRRWYAGSALVILVGIVAMIVLGLNPSIDFKGGSIFEGPRNGHSIDQIAAAVNSTGVTVEQSQNTGRGSASQFRIETKQLSTAANDNEAEKIENALVAKIGIKRSDINSSSVGSTWGSQITHKAVEGLVVFLLAVVAYLSIRFEWKMALAAIIALIHDLVITAGIYALAGLEVSPSTVIALLTILGYSLYDTVVVFDKVRENTEGITGGSRMTFSEAANLAVNQTLVRSINTSIIALLPVLGLLVIGAGFLGAGSLKDLSFALLIGLAAGAYSSIFIATPLVCEFKEREPVYQQLAKRVAARRGKERSPATLQPATVGAPLTTADVTPEPPLGDAGDPARTDATEPSDQPRGPSAAAQARARAAQQRRSSRGGRPGGRGSRSRKRR
jgi:preprotein translocase subunit SecF